MDQDTMLQALKVDLGITTTAYDVRLSQYLTSAREAIRIEGIDLADTISDCNLIVMYAAWLWKKRDTAEGMPRMLRWMMNNRLFKHKLSED